MKNTAIDYAKINDAVLLAAARMRGEEAEA